MVDDWFDVGTGLVLKETRTIGLRVGSPFVGDLSYIDVSRVRPPVDHPRPLTAPDRSGADVGVGDHSDSDITSDLSIELI